MKKILYIVSNIPIPNIPQNDIILLIARGLKEYYNIQLIYPCEYVPYVPFIKGKLRSLSRVKNNISYHGFNISFFKYIRIPTLTLSCWFIKSFFILNYKKFKKYSIYKLIHAHYIIPDGYLAYMISKMYKIPYIVTVREGDLNKISKLNKKGKTYSIYMTVLSNADKILSVSFNEQYKLKKLGYIAEIIPHGISANCLSLNIKSDESPIILLSVANIEKRKRIEWCINAVKQYAGKKKIVYNIVGNGSELDVLKRIAKGTMHNITIKFHGHVSHVEIFKFYREADIFLLPSKRETFGRVYLEALANGCATIGTKNTGLYGLFSEEEMLFSEHSFDDFRNMLNILIDDPSRINRLKINGYNKVKEGFLFCNIIKKYRIVYDKYSN